MPSIKIDHIAIWTQQLEIQKEFYIAYFQGKAGALYHNKKKNFLSYFLTFGDGARLEIMSAPDIPDNKNDTISSQHQGIIHIAFEFSSRANVDEKADELRKAGIRILDGPRVTGDGYYEFVTLDPDNNRLEVTAK
jgi:lactoylglutathione lyase